jgi:hypothetical protein
MLNIDMPPVAMPSAVIVTTDSLAACDHVRQVGVRDDLGRHGVRLGRGRGGGAAAAGARVALRMPTVEAEARTAARTLAPTTARRPREESRRAGVVGTGDEAGFEVGTALQPAGVGLAAFAAGLAASDAG